MNPPVTTPVAGVSLGVAAPILKFPLNGSGTITAIVEPANATNKALSWTSSDPSVASVDQNGTVTLHKYCVTEAVWWATGSSTPGKPIVGTWPTDSWVEIPEPTGNTGGKHRVFGTKITIETADGGFKAEYIVASLGPAGGVIFYDRGNGYPGGSGDTQWRYLEAAPVQESRAMYNVPGGHTYAEFSEAVGAGNANTQILGTCSATDYAAAHYCLGYTISNGNGTFDDWFLPSLGEVQYMSRNRASIGMVNQNEELWTSSFAASGYCFRLYYHWYDSDAPNNGVGIANYVRPARRF